jgi:large subunit ribosomal protein L19
MKLKIKKIMNKIIDIVEALEKKDKKITKFRVGDSVKIHTKIIEGQKERIQVIEGDIIARRGTGLKESITIRKISYGVGVERVFNLYSPVIDKITVVKRGDVHKAKLYYLKDKKGKETKIKEKKYE